MRRGPFTGNYWRDWLMFHGGVFLFTVFLVWWMPSPWYWLLLACAPTAGFISWLVDRTL